MAAKKKASTSSPHAALLAKAWKSPAFKKKLVADPHGTLASEGITIPKGMTVHIHQNSPKETHLVIPAKPKSALSVKAIEKGKMGPMYTSA